jgi:putative oxidoreductase
MTRFQTVASWLLRIIAAVILLQTLFFKFTGAKESVYIFTTVGAEPWGRIGSGVIELIASLLLFSPRTVVYGAGLGLATMCGAIMSHLTLLGITLPAVNDNGELFTLAVITATCLVAVLVLHRREIPLIGSRLRTA